MGSTHSQISSSNDQGQVQLSTTPMPQLCCLPRLRLPSMLYKLRRSLGRRLRRRKPRRHGAVANAGIEAGAALLRPMPRCSSFGSCGTLLTPTKRVQQPSDGLYAQWKCMFEHSAATPSSTPSQRPHDISEALSGQTTPRGFPSHTDARRCLVEEPLEQPLYDCVAEIKLRRRLSLRLPKLVIGGESSGGGGLRRPSARERRAQAAAEAQLRRELRDLEDYYGGFHYARSHAERLVLI